MRLIHKLRGSFSMIAVKITEDYQSQNDYERELIFIEIIHLRCKKYSKLLYSFELNYLPEIL